MTQAARAFNLPPTLTVAGNDTLPRDVSGARAGADDGRPRTLVDIVGLGDRLHHRLGALSGARQQRVAVARAPVGPVAGAPAGPRPVGRAARLDVPRAIRTG